MHGIELSAAMVARLRAKPGGDAIEVTIGDFATTRVDGTFRLAYLVFNTISNLTTQDAQVACFRNAAAHLEPGGCFVIEVGVPDLQRLPPGRRSAPFHVEREAARASTSTTSSTRAWSRTTSSRRRRPSAMSMPFRYVWPSELDLMARLAGMTLRDRWGGLERASRSPSDSRKHVSVWVKS